MQLFFQSNIPAEQSSRLEVTSGITAGNRVKVLFVIDTLETGGAERSLLENASRFKMVEANVCHVYEGDTLKREFLERGIPVYSLGVKSRYGLIEGFRKLRRLVNETRPNIIVACLTRSELIARCVGKLSGVRVLGTFVSDLYGSAYNAELNRKAKLGVWIFRMINRITARFCFGFIANSEAIKTSNAASLGISPERIVVINRGRDSKKFVYQSRELVSTGPVRFVNIGRLVPIKGQHDLIVAFERYVRRNPGSILHIYGSGICEAPLKKLISELGLNDSVTLRGTNNNIAQVMQSYDCLVCPTHSEGFSGTLVEGMFSGLPILASDIQANKEILSHMRTGYLFEAGSVDSIYNALVWFRDNRYRAYLNAAAAYNDAKKKFDLERIAATFENYIVNVIKRKY